MDRYNVTVPDDLAEWLDEQARLSPSGLLQDAIRAERRTSTHGIRIEGDADNLIVGNTYCEESPFESRSVDGHIGLVCTVCDVVAEIGEGDGAKHVVTCPDCGREKTYTFTGSRVNG